MCTVTIINIGIISNAINIVSHGHAICSKHGHRGEVRIDLISISDIALIVDFQNKTCFFYCQRSSLECDLIVPFNIFRTIHNGYTVVVKNIIIRINIATTHGSGHCQCITCNQTATGDGSSGQSLIITIVSYGRTVRCDFKQTLSNGSLRGDLIIGIDIGNVIVGCEPFCTAIYQSHIKFGGCGIDIFCFCIGCIIIFTIDDSQSQSFTGNQSGNGTIGIGRRGIAVAVINLGNRIQSNCHCGGFDCCQSSNFIHCKLIVVYICQSIICNDCNCKCCIRSIQHILIIVSTIFMSGGSHDFQCFIGCNGIGIDCSAIEYGIIDFAVISLGGKIIQGYSHSFLIDQQIGKSAGIPIIKCFHIIAVLINNRKALYGKGFIVIPGIDMICGTVCNSGTIFYFPDHCHSQGQISSRDLVCGIDRIIAGQLRRYIAVCFLKFSFLNCLIAPAQNSQHTGNILIINIGIDSQSGNDHIRWRDRIIPDIHDRSRRSGQSNRVSSD